MSFNLIDYRRQNFLKIKSLHDRHNLFEDPEFPASDASIYYSKRVPSSVSWRRPHEICSNPKFIVNEASRFDLDQGKIGNCWFVAAVSMLTQSQQMFERVVPVDQSFDGSDYAGIFHFRFWQFGKWYDVVVDDLLPVALNGKLVFCRNESEENEFWAALLEKAYAKLSWSYEGLEAGQTTDALIDMTGGIEETFDLNDIKDNDTFWVTIKNALNHDSMIGCSITPDARINEAKLPNGLVKGHAYAVTGAVSVNIGGQIVRLIRCRNPWGNEVEWNGPWCDNDQRWNSLQDSTRSQMGVKSQQDGEFWMSYQDWLKEFHHVQICSLPPEVNSSGLLSSKRSSWQSLLFDGVWARGISAGGCGQGSNAVKYWSNPQYLLEIKANPTDKLNSPIMMIIACLQKYTRQKRMQNHGRPSEEYIQIRLYKIDDQNALSMLQSGGQNNVHLYPNSLRRLATSGPYINKREVTCRVVVSPGFYLVIPSTYEPNREGKFLIRAFAEGALSGRPMGEVNFKTLPHGNEHFEYRDGMGADPKIEMKQWWDALPEEDKQRIIKMAVPVLGIWCCAVLLRDFFRNFNKNKDIENGMD